MNTKVNGNKYQGEAITQAEGCFASVQDAWAHYAVSPEHLGQSRNAIWLRQQAKQYGTLIRNESDFSEAQEKGLIIVQLFSHSSPFEGMSCSGAIVVKE